MQIFFILVIDVKMGMYHLMVFCSSFSFDMMLRNSRWNDSKGEIYGMDLMVQTSSQSHVRILHRKGKVNLLILYNFSSLWHFRIMCNGTSRQTGGGS